MAAQCRMRGQCVCVCVRACVRECVTYVCVIKSVCTSVDMSIHHTTWSAFLNKGWRCTLIQSMQLVHVSLSSCHSAVLGTQLGIVCYYSITHSSAPSHARHVPAALEWFPALPLQISVHIRRHVCDVYLGMCPVQNGVSYLNVLAHFNETIQMAVAKNN